MRLVLTLLLAVAASGCDLNRTDDAPDPSELFENVSFPLVAGEPLALRGAIRGDNPADSVVVALLDPGPSCVGVRDGRPECEPLWAETVVLSSQARPQRVETTVTVPADIVEVPTDLQFMIVAYGLPLARGHGEVVQVLPAP